MSKNYIKNWLNKKRNDFFAEEILNQLPHLTRTDEMVNDTPNTAHVFYKNIVVRVSKEKGFELLPYEKIKRLVFETDILQREIPLKAQADTKFSADIFRQFVNNVAGKENERQDYLKMLLGYALHKNYNEGQSQSVIFTDSRLGENEGRSGKGTLLQGIKHMYNNPNAEINSNAFAMIDGKNFNSDDKFKFSNCSLSTRFIALEDIKKNYNVEQHFYEVENGFKIDRKGKDPFFIRAKMFITTNETVKIQGGSSKGRFIDFDLADHYSNSYAPIDEFKKWFWGTSFTKEDWADYDYFMLECLYTYLCYTAEHNKIEPIKETKTLTLRKIKEQVGEELVDFLENKIKRHNTNEEGIKADYEYNKKEIYAQFLSETKLKSEKYSQRYFTKQLRLYKTLHHDYQEDKQDKITGKYGQEKRSGGEDFIIFLKT